MKKLIIVFSLLGIITYSSAQVDSIAMNLISEDLGLEIFEGNYTFYIDSFLKRNEFSFYAITPFTSGFSFCYFIKNDSIIEINKFPHGMNRMPFHFEFILSKNQNLFLKTYWYGDGTTSSSIAIYLLEIKEDDIEIVFSDLIYYQSKIENEKNNYNSFSIFENMNNIIIQKKTNDPKQFIHLLTGFDLNLPLPNKSKNIKIEEIFLPN